MGRVAKNKPNLAKVILLGNKFFWFLDGSIAIYTSTLRFEGSCIKVFKFWLETIVIKYPTTMFIPWGSILYQNMKNQGQSLS